MRGSNERVYTLKINSKDFVCLFYLLLQLYKCAYLVVYLSNRSLFLLDRNRLIPSKIKLATCIVDNNKYGTDTKSYGLTLWRRHQSTIIKQLTNFNVFMLFSRFSCFTANLLISSANASTSRSLWMSNFRIYHGALIIIRRTLF